MQLTLINSRNETVIFNAADMYKSNEKYTFYREDRYIIVLKSDETACVLDLESDLPQKMLDFIFLDYTMDEPYNNMFTLNLLEIFDSETEDALLDFSNPYIVSFETIKNNSDNIVNVIKEKLHSKDIGKELPLAIEALASKYFESAQHLSSNLDNLQETNNHFLKILTIYTSAFKLVDTDFEINLLSYIFNTIDTFEPENLNGDLLVKAFESLTGSFVELVGSRNIVYDFASYAVLYFFIVANTETEQNTKSDLPSNELKEILNSVYVAAAETKYTKEDKPNTAKLAKIIDFVAYNNQTGIFGNFEQTVADFSVAYFSIFQLDSDHKWVLSSDKFISLTSKPSMLKVIQTINELKKDVVNQLQNKTNEPMDFNRFSIVLSYLSYSI